MLKIKKGISLLLSTLLLSNAVIVAPHFATTAQAQSANDSNYKSVFSETVKADSKKVSVKVLVNSKLSTDGDIKIDKQSIPFNSTISESVGYNSRTEVKAIDLTGDKKDEIALIFTTGSSASVQAVQVFTNKSGKWSEINTPSDIYSTIPKFMKNQEKKLGVKMDENISYYRTVSLKKGKISFTYRLRDNSATEPNTVGEICQELKYSKSKKKFVLGDTTAKKTLNTPTVKVTAGKKQIKVKYTKVSGATGFEVQYKKDKKAITKTYNTKKTATKTIKNLAKGTYKVKVRAFVKSGKNKSYSAWTKTYTANVK